MSTIHDLSSRNLGVGSSFRFTEVLDRGPSISSIGGLHRKAANQQYNPIGTPQDEVDDARAGFPFKDGYRADVNRTLAPGRVGKFGTDLLLEILLCGFAIGVSAPFIWLAITMARYDKKNVTEHDDDYIKQTTTTVCQIISPEPMYLRCRLPHSLRYYSRPSSAPVSKGLPRTGSRKASDLACSSS
jgi:hypothetical protein